MGDHSCTSNSFCDCCSVPDRRERRAVLARHGTTSQHGGLDESVPCRQIAGSRDTRTGIRHFACANNGDCGNEETVDEVGMFRIRTLLFGLLFGILDALCLPIVKSVSIGTFAPAMMLIPVILYGASPLIFLKGLQGETLTILNLVWDLTSDVVVTLIGLLVFAEQISSVKKIGVLLSFVSLFLMTYEGDGISEAIDSNIAKIRGALGFKQ